MDDLFGSAPTPPPTPAPVKKPKPPTLYPIPAISRRARCTGQKCDAVVWWVEGRRFPISASVAHGGFSPGAPIPELYSKLLDPGDGLGISHFVDCPDAKTFSHRKNG